MTISRRSFLRGSLGVVGACLTPALLLSQSLAFADCRRQKKLVVIHLTGGNDGLNTVVPYGVGAYYDARPGLAIKQSHVLPLSDSLGLHPQMAGLHELFKQGDVGIIQSVGYPDQNRSHFRSSDIWQSAYTDRLSETGWLGRYVDGCMAKGEENLAACNIDSELPLSLRATRFSAASWQDGAISGAAGAIAIGSGNHFGYPADRLGRKLRTIAKLIRSNNSAQIYTTSLDGFDTHANQIIVQAPLLAHLSEALTAFHADLRTDGKMDDVLVLVFSEFGRRVPENGGGGTDHGSAQPVFIIGGSVNGGIYGEHACLTDLQAGDLRSSIDFRTVYATILDRWLSADSSQILGRNFGHVDFV